METVSVGPQGKQALNSAGAGKAKTRIASAEVETRIASAVGRALNRRLIASNDGNPLKTGAGAVS